ncbi:hypothetical protein [uncultured Tolumonas sp.]|uniref:hypothetical protein n=1 Tax=uncultured Tolumonas sp. TaxID=263765 RepID=UPI002A0A745A|nr:hypothetical protein [uncultured Tolumonas sp.]
MKKLMTSLMLSFLSFMSWGADMSHGANNFYHSEQVTMQKVTFKNLYKMDVVGNLFMPKSMDKKTNIQPLLLVTQWAR